MCGSYMCTSTVDLRWCGPTVVAAMYVPDRLFGLRANQRMDRRMHGWMDGCIDAHEHACRHTAAWWEWISIPLHMQRVAGRTAGMRSIYVWMDASMHTCMCVCVHLRGKEGRRVGRPQDRSHIDSRRDRDGRRTGVRAGHEPLRKHARVGGRCVAHVCQRHAHGRAEAQHVAAR
eukprot:195118-Chlamydomonas_euryale.AAC.9